MRIAFYDTGGLTYHAASVDSEPLGGAESAACYLSRSLAHMGHDVFLLTKLAEPGMYDGVHCIPHPLHARVPWAELDVVVWTGRPIGLPQVRSAARRARVMFWSPHTATQPLVQFMGEPGGWELFDVILFVSEWQREQFRRHFGIPIERTFVLRNAIGFAFESQFKPGDSVLAGKSRPPVLAYTSTPFRGLDVLLDAFPSIRDAVPGVRLKVFSGMRVYQTPADQDAAQYGMLYERCASTEGVEYVGSVPQPQLAGELREVSVLSYPNTFPETSCIAVMEAMASGCRIVTSQLGALPETTAGFARLIDPHGTRERYVALFAEQTIAAARECMAGDPAIEQLLANQMQWTRQNCTWAVRARQFIDWVADAGPSPHNAVPRQANGGGGS